MGDLEFMGRMNPQPFISPAEEEGLRLEEIKKRLLNDRSGTKILVESEKEFTNERAIQEDY